MTTTEKIKRKGPGQSPMQLVLERVRKMTPQQRIATLVKAGIVLPNGKLAPAYGG